MTNLVRAQSLAKLQAAIALNTQVLGVAEYDDGKGRMCGIGILLTDAQRADIKRRRLNHQEISTVAKKIGWNNLTAVTGLNVKELEELQLRHDNWANAVDSFYTQKEAAVRRRQFVTFVGKLAQKQG
jgi:hypothetical protein